MSLLLEKLAGLRFNPVDISTTPTKKPTATPVYYIHVVDANTPISEEGKFPHKASSHKRLSCDDYDWMGNFGSGFDPSQTRLLSRARLEDAFLRSEKLSDEERKGRSKLLNRMEFSVNPNGLAGYEQVIRVQLPIAEAAEFKQFANKYNEIRTGASERRNQIGSLHRPYKF